MRSIRLLLFFSEFQHPSTRIKSSYSSKLSGKRILLGITGSIAAFQSPMIARELIRHGAIVQPVYSDDGLKMVGKDLMWWATGEEPITKITGNLEHISIAGVMNKPVDLMLIAPATTNTVAKLAAGIGDTPVTLIASSILGKGIPLMVLCVAHEDLINSPLVQKGLNTLKSIGATIIEPLREEGKAKVPNIQDIVFEVMQQLATNEFNGNQFIIASGPTREKIDDVRFISNPSSGLTGIELAKEAMIRGAKVELVLGPTHIETPRIINRQDVQSTQEMIDAVMGLLKKNPVATVILAAAIADFKLEAPNSGKIKSGKNLTLNLVPTQKLSDIIKKEFPKSKLILYKAESNLSENELIQRAKEKLEKTNADLIVANDISKDDSGFAKTTNSIIIINKDGVLASLSDTKENISAKIIDVIAKL